MTLVGWILAAIGGLLVLEYGSSRLLMNAYRNASVDSYASSASARVSIVFPGLANPPKLLGQGMQRILLGHGPMLVANYDTNLTFEKIYQAVLHGLAELNGPRQIFIYGHSLGGQIGDTFALRYTAEGSPYGEITELLLDCTPSTARSLPAPRIVKRALRLYSGGPIGALLVALGNAVTRFTIPVQLSPTVNRVLYRRYARELLWYNNRAWMAQTRYMLRYRPTQSKRPWRTYYICAQNPQLDKLVNQRAAIKEWGAAVPNLQVIRDACVGHAWPMEQPEAYERLVANILAAA